MVATCRIIHEPHERTVGCDHRVVLEECVGVIFVGLASHVTHLRNKGKKWEW